ncbi:MAG: peroxiredoxin [Wenzhouxiangella sp.]|nr:peroxiredoxin [Wenzhouxiangella sp.]MCH8477549.1 peroxiredoxin [Wenzhouxiangella sp.]TVR95167.1 MAG: peroxiredoxin [Wenzhouxiangellaceae bacterium]
MTIAVGDRIPEASLTMMGAEGPKPVNTAELFGQGRTVLFAVPGAFTPTCSANHLPGFVDQAEDFRAKGVDRIVCMAVNDVFVMDAWGKAGNVEDSLIMVADGNGQLASALGLEMDASAFGMGKRSQRFAMIIDDGKVSSLFVEAPGEFRVSSAEHVLSQL